MKKSRDSVKLRSATDLVERYFSSRRKDDAGEQRKMEEMLHAVVELCPSPLCVLDEKTRIMDCNHLFLTCLERARKKVIGKPFLHFLTSNSQERFTQSLTQIESEKELDETFQFSLTSGETSSFRVQAHPMADQMGQINALICILHDLVKDRPMQEGMGHQLIQSERLALFGRIIDGVLNELNNVFASISGYSQLIPTQHELPPSVHKDLVTVYEEARRGGAIVHNLQRFSRTPSVSQSLVQIHQLIDSTVDLMGYTFRVSNIQVGKKYDPKVPPLWIDGRELQQVFLTILLHIENALTPAVSSGLIRITTKFKAKDKKIQISFSHSGPHAPHEDLDKIFHPFLTCTPEEQGASLGLSVSSSIIKAHGGELRVHSKKDEGVTFIVDLPLLRQPKAEGVSPEPLTVPPLDASLPPNRILVVDDEKFLAWLIQSALSSKGYQVDCSLDGEEALEKLVETNYDVVLCDVQMPGLTGPDMYRAIEKIDPRKAQKFVFCTGDSQSQVALAFFKEHPVPTLQKPFDLEELYKLIEARIRGNNERFS